MTYKEKLLDPRWQKKRLEVMQRENFKCENCGDGTNVHHGYYERGFDPWDYPNETLQCLCETCHEKIQDKLADVHRKIASLNLAGLENLESDLDDFEARIVREAKREFLQLSESVKKKVRERARVDFQRCSAMSDMEIDFEMVCASVAKKLQLAGKL